MSEHIQVSSKNRIMTIHLNRADHLNAMTRKTAYAIRQAWEQFNASDDLVAVITGRDEAFTAGADVEDLADPTSEGWEIHQCIPGLLVEVEKPIVSAVAGWCVGAGLYMVQATDLIVAAENAKFVYPEAKMGMGGSWVPTCTATRLPMKIAMELALVGDPISAQRAYDVGMVNAVVEVGQQTEKAYEYAEKIAANAPASIRQMKRHLLDFGPQVQADLVSHMPDRRAAGKVSGDKMEGVAAFREGRKPVFEGH